MSSQARVSRRGFLKLTGMAASAAILGACTPRTATVVETPSTASPLPPTLTPAPTSTPAPRPSAVPTMVYVPRMVLVEAGTFQMGSTDGYADEQPVHTVRITRSFYVGACEVTFDEYDRFCVDTSRRRAQDGGRGRGTLPVLNEDWYDAVAYCNWLSEREGLTPCYSGTGKGTECDFLANGFRLPTEAEWEYAARGGRQSGGFLYAGSNDPDDVAWYAENANDQPRPVGQKQPNELGLYDMSGNLFEWCWDWYGGDYYAMSPDSDPLGPPAPKTVTPWELVRVRRSGCWREEADSVRTTFRSFDIASYLGDNGFRLVRTAEASGTDLSEA
jgi:sulfatase modifying factor 1